MIPGTAKLGPEGVSYDDLIKLAFAANDIDHQVKVDMSIRVHFGAKIFGLLMGLYNEKIIPVDFMVCF